MLQLGVIGYGNRIGSIVDLLVGTGKARVAAVTDIRNEELQKALTEKGYADVHFYTDAEKMMKEERLDGVLIGTRCSLHTHFAMLVAKHGLPMFLEKPVCTSEADLLRLKSIPAEQNQKTVVSFPLRVSSLLMEVKKIVDSGKLGKIEHVQAYNNVSYGRGYFHMWYREEKETGGQFLQKATHDLDYICYILGENRPVRVCAVKSKQVFKGTEPAGKKCADCEKTDICPESPRNLLKKNGGGVRGEYCCFAEDVTIEDSGSCIVEFESGMHAVYSQNFIVRNDAGRRGARLIGYYGTLEFDWVTGKITVYRHLEPIKEEYTLSQGNGHFGGDTVLADNFLGVMEGKAASVAPLSDGILSAELCLAAKRSSIEKAFVELKG